MKQKDFENEIKKAMEKFLQEHLGETVNDIVVEMHGNTLVVRLENVLSPAERNMARGENGRKLIKELKEKLVERSRPFLESMIQKFCKVEILDIRSVFMPEKGERVEIFVLSKNVNELFEEQHDNIGNNESR